MPLLEGLLLMTSAVWRNCLTCSLVSGVLSAARPAIERMTQARTARRGLEKGLRYSCMGGVLRKLPYTVPPGHARRQHLSLLLSLLGNRFRQIFLYYSPARDYPLATKSNPS